MNCTIKGSSALSCKAVITCVDYDTWKQSSQTQTHLLLAIMFLTLFVTCRSWNRYTRQMTLRQVDIYSDKTCLNPLYLSVWRPSSQRQVRHQRPWPLTPHCLVRPVKETTWNRCSHLWSLIKTCAKIRLASTASHLMTFICLGYRLCVCGQNTCVHGGAGPVKKKCWDVSNISHLLDGLRVISWREEAKFWWSNEQQSPGHAHSLHKELLTVT